MDWKNLSYLAEPSIQSLNSICLALKIDGLRLQISSQILKNLTITKQWIPLWATLKRSHIYLLSIGSHEIFVTGSTDLLSIKKITALLNKGNSFYTYQSPSICKQTNTNL